ncbi:MAG: bifunctional diaminohydroxyphosphoribosylaminopyrimidine deaminase/5-amino-6-(5-phosphoribosylamino)uracil reductase RibD [Proteobacteria bacterium]|nr:bifunctional diaminohydroxyphosphoribosylaminopyrimidine deaminase/5-amino-6-(5-phosphoribosylamino)uracil reductase RibD [Pseudomonadota bacterium]
MNSAVSVPAETDKRWMRAAVAQSRHAEGRTKSNPPVGCVILDKSGRLCAAAHTGIGGVPHAETQALDMAGKSAKGGTVYVTLEPCAHHGKTPPCIDALIAAGVARIVVAVGDPDARVNGRGLEMARAAGIEVNLGVESVATMAVLHGFLRRISAGKPYVWLKTAASLDGRIALSDGKKRWLTGDPMRYFVHELRSRCDALLTGIGTILADDPELTCRAPAGDSDSPVVFVLDSQLRTPPNARLFGKGQRKVTLFCTESAPKERFITLQKTGATVIILPTDSQGQLDLHAVLNHLGTIGINTVLVEAGTGVTTAMLGAGLVDKIYWTQSQHILGADARPVVGPFKLVAMPPQNLYTQLTSSWIGQDQLRVFVRDVNQDKTG